MRKKFKEMLSVLLLTACLGVASLTLFPLSNAANQDTAFNSISVHSDAGNSIVTPFVKNGSVPN